MSESCIKEIKGEQCADIGRNAGNALDDYELSGIETIARGVCVRDGMILLCRAKGGSTTYLPGGHIEFGETGRQALVREIKEEIGLASKAGTFLGIVENSFMQKGKQHAEINLVYELSMNGADVEAKEDWIEFEWRKLNDLDDLLPAEFHRLKDWPNVRFGD